MKKFIKSFFFIAIIFSVSACGTSENARTNSSDQGEKLITIQEVAEGDFVYRLVTEKAEYEKGEDVNLFAELEYVGDEESINIYHAASPFYFNIDEKTRDYFISYAMNEPLIETVLKKGEPLHETYRKSGGYSEHDDQQYIDFMKVFLQGNHFPTGEYEVKGIADFFIRGEQETTKMFKLNAEVGFKVK